MHSWAGDLDRKIEFLDWCRDCWFVLINRLGPFDLLSASSESGRKSWEERITYFARSLQSIGSLTLEQYDIKHARARDWVAIPNNNTSSQFSTASSGTRKKKTQTDVSTNQDASSISPGRNTTCITADHVIYKGGEKQRHHAGGMSSAHYVHQIINSFVSLIISSDPRPPFVRYKWHQLFCLDV